MCNTDGLVACDAAPPGLLRERAIACLSWSFLVLANIVEEVRSMQLYVHTNKTDAPSSSQSENGPAASTSRIDTSSAMQHEISRPTIRRTLRAPLPCNSRGDAGANSAGTARSQRASRACTYASSSARSSIISFVARREPYSLAKATRPICHATNGR